MKRSITITALLAFCVIQGAQSQNTEPFGGVVYWSNLFDDEGSRIVTDNGKLIWRGDKSWCLKPESDLVPGDCASWPTGKLLPVGVIYARPSSNAAKSTWKYWYDTSQTSGDPWEYYKDGLDFARSNNLPYFVRLAPVLGDESCSDSCPSHLPTNGEGNVDFSNQITKDLYEDWLEEAKINLQDVYSKVRFDIAYAGLTGETSGNQEETHDWFTDVHVQVFGASSLIAQTGITVNDGIPINPSDTPPEWDLADLWDAGVRALRQDGYGSYSKYADYDEIRDNTSSGSARNFFDSSSNGLFIFEQWGANAGEYFDNPTVPDPEAGRCDEFCLWDPNAGSPNGFQQLVDPPDINQTGNLFDWHMERGTERYNACFTGFMGWKVTLGHGEHMDSDDDRDTAILEVASMLDRMQPSGIDCQNRVESWLNTPTEPQPPTLTIITPIDGALFGTNEPIVIEAEIFDPSGWIRDPGPDSPSTRFFAYYSNGVEQEICVPGAIPFNYRNVYTPSSSTATSSARCYLRPFTDNWPPPAGTYDVSIRAYGSNETVESELVRFTVADGANTAPEFNSFTSSVNGDEVTLTAAASDSDGLRRMRFYSDDSFISGCEISPPSPFICTMNNVEAGEYRYYALVEDILGGNDLSDALDVTVEPYPGGTCGTNTWEFAVTDGKITHVNDVQLNTPVVEGCYARWTRLTVEADDLGTFLKWTGDIDRIGHGVDADEFSNPTSVSTDNYDAALTATFETVSNPVTLSLLDGTIVGSISGAPSQLECNQTGVGTNVFTGSPGVYNHRVCFVADAKSGKIFSHWDITSNHPDLFANNPSGFGTTATEYSSVNTLEYDHIVIEAQYIDDPGGGTTHHIDFINGRVVDGGVSGIVCNDGFTDLPYFDDPPNQHRVCFEADPPPSGESFDHWSIIGRDNNNIDLTDVLFTGASYSQSGDERTSINTKFYDLLLIEAHYTGSSGGDVNHIDFVDAIITSDVPGTSITWCNSANVGDTYFEYPPNYHRVCFEADPPPPGFRFDSWKAETRDANGTITGEVTNSVFTGEDYSKSDQPNSSINTGAANSGNDYLLITANYVLSSGTSATGVTIPVRIWLHGPYSDGAMGTGLNSYLPQNQPYNVAPWNYTGNDFASSVPSNVVDWVLVEIRSSTNSGSTIARRSAWLTSNGDIVEVGTSVDPVFFEGVGDGNYYVVVKHRNHLAIMSANMLSLSATTAFYDFSVSQTRAYGSNAMKSVGKGGYALWGGDGNADGDVTSTDFSQVWAPQNGSSGYLMGDFNLSGSVTSSDYTTVWLAANGQSSQLPGGYEAYEDPTEDGLEDFKISDADVFKLGAPYPNPANPQSTFTLTLARDQHVRIELFDILGRRVQMLQDGMLSSGTQHHFVIDGSMLSSGVYLYRVKGDHFEQTQRFTLLK